MDEREEAGERGAGRVARAERGGGRWRGREKGAGRKRVRAGEARGTQEKRDEEVFWGHGTEASTNPLNCDQPNAGLGRSKTSIYGLKQVPRTYLIRNKLYLRRTYNMFWGLILGG